MLASRWSWPSPRPRAGLRALLLTVWTAPTNAVGHLAGLLLAGGRPRRVAGPSARAWLYAVRPGRLRWAGAVAIGHAVLHRPDAFAGPSGRFLLAHELAHTRQHDVLGPLYLPLHAFAQLASLWLTLLRRERPASRIHAWNPLETRWTCLGIGLVGPMAAGRVLSSEARERFLAALGA